ncbi:MAG TPA: 3-isopropylmalate dehydratase large subunit [Candidatus Omnitrophica bacterium]|nr:3-isopropylmalate dehydratase large subunit [Candidatus Omnitrophota bacterium]
MKQTITQKILAKHCGKKAVVSGEFIWAGLDFTLGNDITAPIAIDEFEKSGFTKVFNKEKIALIPDHFTPAKDIKSAQQAKRLREFAAKHKIRHYYEVGRMGIEHALLPQLGLVGPGDLIIGSDSHTCTYGALGAFSTGVGSTDLAAGWITGHVWLRVPETIKFVYKGKLPKWVGGKDFILYTIGDIGVEGARYNAMEFAGEAIRKLPMDDRFAMCNMAIEAGGKSGIVEPDEVTLEYVISHQMPGSGKKINVEYLKEKFSDLRSDKDAVYTQIKEYDVSKWEPAVALPHLPSNVKPVSKVGKVRVDQVVIGSCTNGRISDLRISAKILKGNKVDPRVRLIVIPATQEIYLQAMKEGLLEVFVKAGGVVSTPTCGPCLGGHMGILADGEACLATTNRNFMGRMGDKNSFVFLSSPAVAAASAITGYITHPEEVIKKGARF